MTNKSRANLASLLSLAIAFAPSLSLAATISDSFETTTRKETATLVWNPSLGQLHPPFKVWGWEHAAGAKNKSFSVGTGEHGVFDASTYASFDEDGDPNNTVIEIDTTRYPNGLNVTNFELTATMTIRPTGTAPFIVRSLLDIRVSGTIDCSGGDGGSLNAALTPVSGGEGRCGGKNGGDGESLSTPATDGTNASVVAEAGKSSNPGAPGGSGGLGGGGGGSYNFSGGLPDAGEDPNTVGADDGSAAGTIDVTDSGFDASDEGFVDLHGGAGGGGGSRSNDSSGGGGGAGGGVVVLLAARDIEVVAGTGLITADGGDGGGGGAGLTAGGGGGGGGGTIVTLAGRDLISDQLNGMVARAGNGGVTTNAANGGSNGGNGAPGRYWGSDGTGGIGGGGSEDPGNLFAVGAGDVLSDEGSFTAQSTVFDLSSTRPRLTAVTPTVQTTAANTVTIEIASGESPGFDPTGRWVTATSLVGQELERYVRFRVTLANTDRTQASAKVDALTIEYAPYERSQFEFKSGCGWIETPKTRPPIGWMTFFLIAPLAVMVGLRRKRSP